MLKYQQYMVISLSKNLFTANVNTKPNPSKLASTSNTQQSAEPPADNEPIASTKETATTDNIQSGNQNEPVAKPSESFSQTLRKKIAARKSTEDNAQADEETKKQDENLAETPKIVCSAKSLIPPATLTQPEVLDKTIDVKVDNQLQQQIESKIPVESQVPEKSVQLLTESKNPQISSLIIEADKKPDTVSTPDNKALQPTVDQNQVKSEMITPDISDNSPIDKKNNKEAASVADAGDSKITIAYPAGGELISQTLSDDSNDNKAAADSKKSVTISTLTIPLVAETILPAKPVVISTPSSNEQNQESPVQTAETTTTNKADINQKDSRSKTEFSDLLKDNKFNIETLSVKSVEQKMSQPQTQPSALQAEKRDDLSLKQTSGPDMELGKQTPLVNNVQPVISEHSSASTASAKVTGNAEAAVSVSSQIQESIHSSFRSNSQEIIIHLNPPELGKVTIKFTEQDNAITGLLQVDKSQTRSQIQQALPEIIQNLHNSGIQIKNIEVVLTNQQEQYTPKDQSSAAGQNGWSGHQNSPNPEAQRNNNFYSEQLTYTNNLTELAEPRMQFIGSSINMLA
ncbi:MAG: flagellar hook-length control protein FliK [Sedimentisphaerales bacterium]